MPHRDTFQIIHKERYAKITYREKKRCIKIWYSNVGTTSQPTCDVYLSPSGWHRLLTGSLRVSRRRNSNMCRQVTAREATRAETVALIPRDYRLVIAHFLIVPVPCIGGGVSWNVSSVLLLFVKTHLRTCALCFSCVISGCQSFVIRVTHLTFVHVTLIHFLVLVKLWLSNTEYPALVACLTSSAVTTGHPCKQQKRDWRGTNHEIPSPYHA